MPRPIVMPAYTRSTQAKPAYTSFVGGSVASNVASQRLERAATRRRLQSERVGPKADFFSKRVPLPQQIVEEENVVEPTPEMVASRKMADAARAVEPAKRSEQPRATGGSTIAAASQVPTPAESLNTAGGSDDAIADISPIPAESLAEVGGGAAAMTATPAPSEPLAAVGGDAHIAAGAPGIPRKLRRKIGGRGGSSKSLMGKFAQTLTIPAA